MNNVKVARLSLSSHLRHYFIYFLRLLRRLVTYCSLLQQEFVHGRYCRWHPRQRCFGRRFGVYSGFIAARSRFLDHLVSSVLIQVNEEFSVGKVCLLRTAPVPRWRFLQAQHFIPVLEVVVLLSIPVFDYNKPKNRNNIHYCIFHYMGLSEK